jgi:hypothetical protein
MRALRGTSEYYAYEHFYVSLDAPEYLIRKAGVELKYEDDKVLEFAREFGISANSTRLSINKDTFYRYIQEEFIRSMYTAADIDTALSGLRDDRSQELRALSSIIELYRIEFPASDLFEILFTIKAHMVSLTMLSFTDYIDVLQKNGNLPGSLERFGVRDTMRDGDSHIAPGSFDPGYAINCFRKAAVTASVIRLLTTGQPGRINEPIIGQVVGVCAGIGRPEQKLTLLRDIPGLTPEEVRGIGDILDLDLRAQEDIRGRGMASRISYPDSQIFEYLRHLYPSKTDDDLLDLVIDRMNVKGEEVIFNEAVKRLVCERMGIGAKEYKLYVNAIKEYENIQKYFCKGALLSRLRNADPETVAMAVSGMLEAAVKEENVYILKCFASNLSDLAKDRGLFGTGVFITTADVMKKLFGDRYLAGEKYAMVLGESLVLADRDSDNMKEMALSIINGISQNYGIQPDEKLVTALGSGDWQSLRVNGSKICFTGTAQEESRFLAAYADRMKFRGNAALFGSWLGRFSEISGRHRLRIASEIKAGLDANKGLPNTRHIMHASEEFLYVLPLVKRLRDDPDIFEVFIARGTEPFYNAWRMLAEKYVGPDSAGSAAYTTISRKLIKPNDQRDMLHNSIAVLLSDHEYDQKISGDQWDGILSALATNGLMSGLNKYLKETWGKSDGIEGLRRDGVSRGELVKYVSGYGLGDFLKY